MRKRTALIVCLTAFATLMLWLVRRDTVPSSVPATGTPPPATPTGIDRDLSVVDPPAQDSLATRATGSTDAKEPVPGNPFFRIIGRVVDEHGGSIAGAEVLLHAVSPMSSPVSDMSMLDVDAHPHDGLTTSTHADGTFTIAGRLPRAEWLDVDVEPAPHLAHAVRHFGPGFESDFRRLVSGDNDLGHIVLSARGAAQGRLVTENGAPIADALIVDETGEQAASNSRVTTDAHGHFLLGHLPPGKVSLSIRIDQRIEIRAENEVDIRAGETTDMSDIPFSTDDAITGTVVDASGKGLPGILVLGKQDSSGTSSTRTRIDGSFTLWCTFWGPCKLDVLAPAFDPWEHDEATRYEPGTQDVRIVLACKGRMTFRVVDTHTHQPIERFGIAINPSFGGARSATEPERALPLEDHPGGEVVLSVPHRESSVAVRAPGHALLTTAVEEDPAGSLHQTLALTDSSSVHGRVTSSGAPVPAAALTLMPDGIDTGKSAKSAQHAPDPRQKVDVPSLESDRRTVYAALDGSFAFDDLTPGTYALEIDGRGAAKTTLRGLIVPPESALDLGDVALAAGATVRGVVITRPGESPRGFVVTLDARNQPQSAISDAQGAFEIAGIAAGKHTLTWSRWSENTGPRTNDPREQVLELAAGEIENVSIDATSSAPCKLIVHVVHGGVPMAGVVLRIRYESGSNHPSSTTSMLGATDAEGRIEAKVDGDARFSLLAETTGEIPLGNLAEHLSAVPGGLVERTFVVRAGRLLVEEPAGLQRPDAGVVDISMWGSDFGSKSLRAYTPRALLRPAVARIWQSGTIDFGEWPPGDYQVRVTFSSTGIDEKDPTEIVYETLRGPFTTNVHIVDGEDARVVMR